MNFEYRPTHSLRPYARNARTHSPKQIKQIARSIERFGFNNPVLIDDEDQILAGHGRLEAAKHLNLKTVPCVRLSHLTEADKKAYVIADNRLAEKSGWDNEILAIELQHLVDFGFDVDLTGFEPAETDLIIEGIGEESEQPENLAPERSDGPAVSRLGDVWLLGKHMLVCGDSTEAATYRLLMGDERADFVFTDPPYNVRIDGHVSGLGRIKHREFAMASGEMNEDEFTAFLSKVYAFALPVLQRWFNSPDLHGLASYAGNAGRGRCQLLRAEECVHLEQEQRRDGLVLSLQARDGIRLEERFCAAHQHF